MARHPPLHLLPAPSAAVHACHARQPQPRPCREKVKGRGREVPSPHAVPRAVVAGEGRRGPRKRGGRAPPSTPGRAEFEAFGGMEGGRRRHGSCVRPLQLRPCALWHARCSVVPRILPCRGERGKGRDKGGAGGRPRRRVRSRGVAVRAEAGCRASAEEERRGGEGQGRAACGEKRATWRRPPRAGELRVARGCWPVVVVPV